ncbi:hypothetical protein AOLI_G00028670 [Acnodon oligacanthus]
MQMPMNGASAPGEPDKELDSSDGKKDLEAPSPDIHTSKELLRATPDKGEHAAAHGREKAPLRAKLLAQAAVSDRFSARCRCWDASPQTRQRRRVAQLEAVLHSAPPFQRSPSGSEGRDRSALLRTGELDASEARIHTF